MENLPNLRREKVTQIQETQRVPIKRNPKRPTSRHIIIKMAEFQDKDRILNIAWEKQEVTYKGAPIRLATNFPMETLQARKEWQKNIPQKREIFLTQKSNDRKLHELAEGKIHAT